VQKWVVEDLNATASWLQEQEEKASISKCVFIENLMLYCHFLKCLLRLTSFRVKIDPDCLNAYWRENH
jgi:hypothetical protein